GLLPPEQRLVENREYIVFQARASQIPHVLYEIGRLREITFRQVGEGTSKSMDLDRFDAHYIHLFVWNKEKNEVVGAYRLGQADEILGRFGKEGLYTHTLFEYKDELLEQISPALELGRSFIRVEYQKNYSPLLLLWKGIGQFISRNPQYKTLFGAVSISDNYHSMSQQLIVAFLKMHDYLPHLAKFVKARIPFRSEPIKGWEPNMTRMIVKDIEEISALISDIEADQKGIPILLKQYLKLGGKLLGFNIDPHFNNSLDGLILVNLTQTNPKVLEQYMGKDGAGAFLGYHQKRLLRNQHSQNFFQMVKDQVMAFAR
ncbi:MAG: GNAT family N-acetyltransferase, partial [Nitrospira sp.]|nr:GNAT family N-acetyltransferase [Nitrospira sp.]